MVLVIILLVSACGYHLKASNTLAENYPKIKINISAQSLLKRSLVNAMLSSGVELVDKNMEGVAELNILKDSLRKVVQSIGANNQVQEYRLEYDVEYNIAENCENKGEITNITKTSIIIIDNCIKPILFEYIKV